MSFVQRPRPTSLIDYFQDLEDPRIDRTKRHPLINVLFMAICAVLGDAEGWEDIETFAKSKQAWFAQYLKLPEGPHPVPSDDTFRRTISRLDPAAFEEAFRRWVAAVAKRIGGEIIALDGKTVRGSYNRDTDTLASEGAPQKPLHMVSAWASEQRLVLAQEVVGDKTNEISVLPDLLEVLELEGCLVTIDAMGTQKDIAEQIVGRGGDYVLALKSNHPHLYDDVRTFFEEATARDFRRIEHQSSREVDGAHGRIEVRRCWATGDIAWLARADRWPGLRSIAMVEAERSEHRWDEEAGGRAWTTTTQRRYYISSLAPAEAEENLAKRIAVAARSHWSIENRVHWVLDVSFGEDRSRIRKRHGPENVSVLRRIAMNLVRQDKRRGSLRQKRKRAGWDDTYREEILGI